MAEQRVVLVLAICTALFVACGDEGARGPSGSAHADGAVVPEDWRDTYDLSPDEIAAENIAEAGPLTPLYHYCVNLCAKRFLELAGHGYVEDARGKRANCLCGRRDG